MKYKLILSTLFVPAIMALATNANAMQTTEAINCAHPTGVLFHCSATSANRMLPGHEAKQHHLIKAKQYAGRFRLF